MNPAQLLSWRFSLIFFHRWLGIAVGVMFILWTLSGGVLMYYGIPHYTAGDRLAHLPPLDLTNANLGPEEALQKVPGTAFRLRISMQDNRPAYRINTGNVFGNWTTVFADTGTVMQPLNQDDVIYMLAKLYPEYTETMFYVDYLRQPDFFTHSPALQNRVPLHVIDMGNSELYYVSEKTGDIVMHTTPTTQVLGALGYNIHTLFFWRQQKWHTGLLLWLSWLGLGMTLLGIVLGIWRFNFRPAQQSQGVASRTPYSGWWKWHHYAGLLFGAVMFTWMFSGLVSLSAVPGIDESLYTPEQIKAGARTVQGFASPLNPALLTLRGMQDGLAKLKGVFPVKEMEVQMVNGKAYYLAYRSPDKEELAQWVSHSAMDFMNPALEWDHRFITTNDPDAQPFSDFAEPDLLRMAANAMPGQEYTELAWLQQADDYYYPRVDSFDLGLPRAARTFPVLRLKYDDPKQTWLYLSPSHAQLVKMEAIDRRNRWGYYGLHALDFAVLWQHRPLWDVIVLILLLGCIAMALTSVSPAWERLKRHYFRLLDKLGHLLFSKE